MLKRLLEFPCVILALLYLSCIAWIIYLPTYILFGDDKAEEITFEIPVRILEKIFQTD